MFEILRLQWSKFVTAEPQLKASYKRKQLMFLVFLALFLPIPILPAFVELQQGFSAETESLEFQALGTVTTELPVWHTVHSKPNSNVDNSRTDSLQEACDVLMLKHVKTCCKMCNCKMFKHVASAMHSKQSLYDLALKVLPALPLKNKTAKVICSLSLLYIIDIYCFWYMFTLYR